MKLPGHIVLHVALWAIFTAALSANIAAGVFGYGKGIPLRPPPVGVTRWQVVTGKVYVRRMFSSSEAAWIWPNINLWFFRSTKMVVLRQFAWERSEVIAYAWLDLGALLALSSTGPTVSMLIAVAQRRKRRSASLGFCMNCGYDLRATPQRCPECGRDVEQSQRDVLLRNSAESTAARPPSS
jgi:hypothetical protein